jgi:hypothetical protein
MRPKTPHSDTRPLFFEKGRLRDQTNFEEGLETPGLQRSSLGTEVKTKKAVPHAGVPPRLLNLREASAYWGVSLNLFMKLVRAGIAPPPVNLPVGRFLFDRHELDRAIDSLGGKEVA